MPRNSVQKEGLHLKSFSRTIGSALPTHVLDVTPGNWDLH